MKERPIKRSRPSMATLWTAGHSMSMKRDRSRSAASEAAEAEDSAAAEPAAEAGAATANRATRIYPILINARSRQFRLGRRSLPGGNHPDRFNYFSKIERE